jgi:8-oxo-dGTP diphosphatase
MKIIAKLTEKDFNRVSTPEKWASYRLRPGARALLLNDWDEIALMHVSKLGYYKLPGGGIDEGESIEDGLMRELAEEVGVASAKVLSEIGEVVEYRDTSETRAEHYAFIVKLTDMLNTPTRTQKEIDQGYKTVWVKNLDEAIKLVEAGSPPVEGGYEYERLRELAILRYVRDSELVHLITSLT